MQRSLIFPLIFKLNSVYFKINQMVPCFKKIPRYRSIDLSFSGTWNEVTMLFVDSSRMFLAQDQLNQTQATARKNVVIESRQLLETKPPSRSFLHSTLLILGTGVFSYYDPWNGTSWKFYTRSGPCLWFQGSSISRIRKIANIRKFAIKQPPFSLFEFV